VTDKKAFSRKHFFIDRKFQGRYMITFLVPTLVMLVFLLFTLYFASQSIINATTRIIREDVESIAATHLQDRPDPSTEDYRGVIDDTEDYLRTFSRNEKYRRALVTALMWVFGTGLFIVIVQIVLLTIFVSHKVAGPVYRLEKTCHELIEGDYTEKIALRKGDEMQNLARLFNEAIRLTRERMQVLRDETDPEKRESAVSSLRL
jgi:HAMP domain-containing protein